MHMDPIMPYVVGSVLAILLIGMVLRAVRQPHVVGYLLAGIALGPSGLAIVADQATIARLGEVGVVLLLFFVGMEVSLPNLVSRWRVPVLGTLLQIAVSVGVVLGIAAWAGWPIERGILLGFVISLSSTAVVIKLLQAKNELNAPVGQDVVGILLTQDLAIVPMLIAISVMGGNTPSTATLVLQVVGGIFTIAFLGYIATRDQLWLPLGKWVGDDHEMQVFAAGLVCFGMALATGLMGLSAALGAFIGGVVIGAAKETEWIHAALFPLHVLLLALFFVSIGMLVDLSFVWRHAGAISLLVAAVFVTNTVVNMLILRALGRTWQNSLYGGALLSQIGEFSFVLAAIGMQAGIIEDFGYQITVAVVALSMVLSPTWIFVCGRLRRARGASPRLEEHGTLSATE